MPLLTIQIPATDTLITNSADGLSPDRDAFDKPAPVAAIAVGEILKMSRADHLLLGLNEMFGSAADYAIAGGTALQFHRMQAGLSVSRQPNDLDVAVGPNGVARMHALSKAGIVELGFSAVAGDSGGVTWSAGTAEELHIEVIDAQATASLGVFSQSAKIDGIKVLPLHTLKANLETRISQQPNNDNAKADLVAINELLAKQQQLGVSLS